MQCCDSAEANRFMMKSPLPLPQGLAQEPSDLLQVEPQFEQ